MIQLSLLSLQHQDLQQFLQPVAEILVVLVKPADDLLEFGACGLDVVPGILLCHDVAAGNGVRTCRECSLRSATLPSIGIWVQVRGSADDCL